jgi:hypothetical protein
MLPSLVTLLRQSVAVADGIIFDAFYRQIHDAVAAFILAADKLFAIFNMHIFLCLHLAFCFSLKIPWLILPIFILCHLFLLGCIETLQQLIGKLVKISGAFGVGVIFGNGLIIHDAFLKFHALHQLVWKTFSPYCCGSFPEGHLRGW